MMKIILVLFLFVWSGTLSCQQVRSKPGAVALDSAYKFSGASRDGIGKYFLGREIAHVMSAGGSAWLERSERQAEENTALAIKYMKLNKNDVIADIGAGTGYYTFKIAKQVPSGKVFAVEIQDELIALLNKRTKELNVKNVEVIKGEPADVNLPENSVDLAIMVDVYHELEWPRELISSLNRCLKSSGRILLIEYRGEDPSVPIKPLHKMSVEQVNKEMNALGFVLDTRGDFLPIQHFLVYKKNGGEK